MADKITDAVNKLFQFGSQAQTDSNVSRKDIGPVLGAVADALLDVKKRLDELATK